MGFEHTRVTSYAPWPNRTVEHFMRNLGKVLKTSQIDDHNSNTSLQCFLRSYRATPHCTMGYPPAQLLFKNRKYNTRLPNATINTDLFQHKEVQENDQRHKAETKRKADNKAYVKTANLQTGNKVLCRHPRQNKLKSAYDPIPHTITKINSSQIMGTNETHTIKRHITFSKCYSNNNNNNNNNDNIYLFSSRRTQTDS